MPAFAFYLQQCTNIIGIDNWTKFAVSLSLFLGIFHLEDTWGWIHFRVISPINFLTTKEKKRNANISPIRDGGIRGKGGNDRTREEQMNGGRTGEGCW